ncbi:MAG: tetratricopeptide repeat protein [Vulcanimicrobiota bacterium]
MTLQRGDLLAGRFEVFRALAGGLGVVYLVFDHEDRVPLAAKTFLAELLPGSHALDAFRREAHTWIGLERHPNIVTAERFELVNGRPFLFLEFVDGGDLLHWIGTPRLTTELALRLALDFCDGMVHAASRGLKVHRDIKPANCMMTSDGRLKITDFGLAKVLDEAGLAAHRQDQAMAAWLVEVARGVDAPPPQGNPHATGAGQAMGTYTHMAPEQFVDAAQVDVRADIYSFGVMLHEMLTGRLPFPGTDLQEFAFHHFRTPAPHLNPEFGSGLDELVQACLAKAPEARPADFGQVRARLVAAMQALQMTPPPPSEAMEPEAVDLSNKAACLLNMGLVPEASRLLDKALAQAPDLSEAWINKGYLLDKTGHPRQALECYRRVGGLRPDARLLNLMGMATARLGDPSAEQLLRQAIEANPRYLLAWQNLCLYLAGQGRLDEALAASNRAVQLAPRDARLFLSRGMLLYQVQQFASAAEAFETCVTLDPTSGSGWNYLGEALLAQGEASRATPCFDRAMQAEPMLALAWLNAGRMLVMAQDYEKALQLLDRALELDPQAALAHYVRGSSLLCLGRFAEAVASLEEATRLDPEDAAAWFNLGQALSQQERAEQARRSFEQARALGHPQAGAVLAQPRGSLIQRAGRLFGFKGARKGP